MEITNLYGNILKIKRGCQIGGIVLAYLWRESVSHTPWGRYVSRKKIRAQKVVYTTQERLRITIEQLGPTYIKFGQILADRPDVVSERLSLELKKLQSHAEPFDNDIALKTIEEELRQPVEQVFESFDRNCLASASIGQVYKATLKDGSKVVVKVRRPNIHKKIKLDLFIMKYLAVNLAKKHPELAALNITGVVDEFSESILNELDYYTEASNMIRFATMFKDSTTVHIPKVYLEYTTKRIIVQEMIEGITPDDIEKIRESGLDPRQIAVNGADALLKMILEYGFFHSDPHAGNMFIMPNNVIGLIDFGMVGVLRPRDINFLSDMAISFIGRNEEGIADALITLCGVRFFDKRDDLVFDIHQLIENNKHLPIEKVDFSKFIQDCIKLVTKYHLNIPTGIFMLAKSLATIQKVAENLDPNIPFAELIKPYAKAIVMAKYSPKKIAGDLFDILKSYLLLAKTLPKDVNEILYNIKQGEIKHNVNFENGDKITNSVRHFGYRLSYAILLSGLFIGAIMLRVNYTDMKYSNFIIFFTSILMMLMVVRLFFKKK